VSIHTQDSALPLLLVQIQHILRCQNQLLEGAGQLRLAVVDAINHDLFIPRGQYATQLTAAPIALLGKVAFGCKGCFPATRLSRHIRIQRLRRLLIIVPVTRAVLLIDLPRRLLHLLNILWRAYIQCLADHRLLCATVTAERPLECQVWMHALVGFHQTVSTGQDGNQRVRQLLHRLYFTTF
jgi:hypothetical protein